MGDGLGMAALIGMIVLGVALAWGMFQNSRRDRSKDGVRDDATRAMYNNEPEGASGRTPPRR